MKRVKTFIHKYRYAISWLMVYPVLLQVGIMIARANTTHSQNGGAVSEETVAAYILAVWLGGAAAIHHASSMTFRSVFRWAINPALALFMAMGAICAFNAKSIFELATQLFVIFLLFSLTIAVTGLSCHELYVRLKHASPNSGNLPDDHNDEHP